MAETSATILIPDISGFTEFMTNTELSHGTHVINMLMEAMINAAGDDYEVSEIEGDAVLLIRKGSAPSQKEITETCLKIFNAFHYRRIWMEQHAICPCGACLKIADLTLKFVAHHGVVAEIKVGRFVKQSGTEMIVAHRLLKNSITNNEYLLLTEKLIQQVQDSSETIGMKWDSSSDEYSSIGKIDYRFALLNDARRKAPVPPLPETNYRIDDTPYIEFSVNANYRDVYLEMMNIPERTKWTPGLLQVEQPAPEVFIGSIHHCSFENFKAVISPLRMSYSNEEILYAESCRIEELNLDLVHEFVFKKVSRNESVFACRFMNMTDSPIEEVLKDSLLSKMKAMGESLKNYCEKLIS